MEHKPELDQRLRNCRVNLLLADKRMGLSLLSKLDPDIEKFQPRIAQLWQGTNTKARESDEEVVVMIERATDWLFYVRDKIQRLENSKKTAKR